MTKQDLRNRYRELYGRNPFNGWKEDKLKELIDAKLVDKPVVEEITDEKISSSDEEKAIKHFEDHPDFTPAVAHINGKPQAIIGDAYYPWADVEILICKGRIKYYEKKLETLLKKKK